VSDPQAGANNSYLVSQFTKLDWGILVTLLLALCGAIWFTVDKSVAASTGELKGEFIVLRDDLQDEHKATRDEFAKLDASVHASFEQLADDLTASVSKGMTERKKDLADALGELFAGKEALTVTVVNIPRRDRNALSMVAAFQEEFGSQSEMYAVGDKIILQTTLTSPGDDVFTALSTTLEKLQEDFPGVQTKIEWSSGGALADQGEIITK